MKEQDKIILEEKEKLRFHCDSCKREWVEERPQDRWIRSGAGTNYYINARQEEGPHHPIRCPKCKDTTKIRRIPPPFRPSIDGAHNPRKAMTKRADNPISTEQMLGDTP